MHPLNPYLRAFFNSALPAQCAPISHHVLLVPTTDVLLFAKDRESNTPYADLAGTEDFLASHVLRVPGGAPPHDGSKDAGNMRENKSKARQYSTMNGRTVVIKESFVYSNKGFKTLNQAQLLSDTIFYPDAADGQQWLVYYISRPLVGICQSTATLPALISDEPSKERRRALAQATESMTTNGAPQASAEKKKEVQTFDDLLNQFPMISRQMQSGLEKIIRDFVAANDKPLPKRSRSSSDSSQRSTPVLSDVASIRSAISKISGETMHPTSVALEEDGHALRSSLESAVMAAIEIFQSVDKHQLSMLGANTELTGPAVERLIERYITEQVHDRTLFPRICALSKLDDSDLESKMRRMTDIDVSQVGIPVQDSMQEKRSLSSRLKKGVDVFRRMGVASSPQEMLEILLNTQIAITATASSSAKNEVESGKAEAQMQTPLTVNADVLVSMLLVVVIRSGVRHLHARLLYMRYFIFIDEVESGEQGYALATFEAVLAYLSSGSSALRRASRFNRNLWQSVKSGDLQAIEAILQAEASNHGSTSSDFSDGESDRETSETDSARAAERRQVAPNDEFVAVNGSLQHIFPFQRPPTPPPERVVDTSRKRVSMASLPRSHSASSAYSSRSHSRHQSVDSEMNGSSGTDLSMEKLAQTQDIDGNSVLMMAIDSSQRDALRYLLALPAHFRASFVLDDVNNDNTTLLSAAVQSGNQGVTDELIDFLASNTSSDELQHYLEIQDSKGRCVAHYLFHQPHLISKFGEKLPWRLKDANGQTPLFALCRSYDHEQYHSMVDWALALATQTQGDGEPLHLDDHVDSKGNTLLHVINDLDLTLKLLRQCDSDINAVNDKRFTPLMVGSKYGRLDLVRALFGDPRLDLTLRDIRGLTAVELAKDDEMRNRIDDLVLLGAQPAADGRITTIVRSLFVEDGSVRLVLKSGAPNQNGTITVTTCRRSASDFEALSKLLAIECPASWLPTHFNLPSPYLIPSRPSRAVLRDTQIRLDNFFHNLLTHGTFSTHELVWEFFLVPDIDIPMLVERSKRKAELRVENVKDDYEPVNDSQEIENFVAFAREQMKGMTSATRKVVRSVNRLRMTSHDFAEAQVMAASGVSTLLLLPEPYMRAYERFSRTQMTSEASPMAGLYYALHSIYSTSTAIQVATNRPAYLIGSMAQAQKAIDRSMGSIARSSRWTPRIGLFEETKRAVTMEAWDKAGKARNELETLSCELKYTQQTIAGELAAWQDTHVVAGRAMLRKLALDTIVRERARLGNMQRALREITKHNRNAAR